jgi:hypothetical protein
MPNDRVEITIFSARRRQFDPSTARQPDQDWSYRIEYLGKKVAANASGLMPTPEIAAQFALEHFARLWRNADLAAEAPSVFKKVAAR